MQVGRYPCGTHGSGMEVNSVLCIMYDIWRHKRCLGLRFLNRAVDFKWLECVRRAIGEVLKMELEMR